MASPLAPTTPVLVGVGIVDQRAQGATRAREPIDLMIAASMAAGDDARAPRLLASLDRILVPVGRWPYGNAAGMVGAAVGSPTAHTVSALPGVSQQTLLSNAASAIAAGEITNALIVGGEAGHRLLQARIEGVELTDTENHGVSDEVMRPDDGMLPPFERERGLGVMPVGYYALIDSAWRRAQGRGVDEHRRLTAERYAAFSRTAAANPHGWDEEPVSVADIENARMMAFPYTKHHVSNWSVDQASALLFTSAREAERLGIPRERWVFPQAFTEANQQTDVSVRGDMHRSIGAELAGHALFEAAGCTADAIDFAELYTCFPVAVDVYAEALGLPDSLDWSFTGGMPFAGGPFNNFVLHSTAQLAEHLRARPGSRGLVTTVSGLLTKQGFAIWGTDPNPRGYTFVDVTKETIATADVRAPAPDHRGPAITVAYTVVHDRSGPEAGVVVIELPDGRRSVAWTDDPELMSAMEREEFCDRNVLVDDGRFTLA